MRRLRKLLCVCVASVCLAGHGSAQDQTLTLEQARALAQSSVISGNVTLARDIAMTLLKADPKDPYPYFILALAHSKLNDDKLARSAARFAYKYAETPTQKHDAARMAGQIAYRQDRPTLSQIWLRRAAIHAQTPVQDQKLKRDYKAAARKNPWSLSISGGIQPSNNVNNGTDAVLEIVDGFDLAIPLADSSRALDGYVGTLDVKLRYKLRQSAQSLTSVSTRVYVKRVQLKEDVRGISSQDFASTYAEASLDHAFALGKAGNIAGVGLTAGQVWSAGTPSFSFAKVKGSRTFRLDRTKRLSFSGSVENRYSDVSNSRDQTILQVGATYRQKLGNGDSFSIALTTRDTRSDAGNVPSTTTSLHTSYAFGKKLGPAKVSASLLLGNTEYPDFRAVLGTFRGTRDDVSAYADVTFFFEDYDFAGFAPTMRIRTGERSSNISTFDSRELSVTLGVRSKF